MEDIAIECDTMEMYRPLGAPKELLAAAVADVVVDVSCDRKQSTKLLC